MQGNTVTQMLLGQHFYETAPKGLFGVEVEMEAVSRKSVSALQEKGWEIHDDGSLVNGVEVVFNGPCDFKEANERILALSRHLKEMCIEPVFSIRTSVHVHLNCNDMTVQQLFNIILLYWAMEPSLSEWCGEDRKGNMFCLRLRDAEFMEEVVRQAIESRDLQKLFQHGDLKYASLNLMPLTRFGSIEFRLMRGTASPVILKRWLNILFHIQKAAKEFKHPAEILFALSEKGAHAFCTEVLGSREKDRLAVDCARQIFNNIRNLQHIIYATNWEDTETAWKPEVPKARNRSKIRIGEVPPVMVGVREQLVERLNRFHQEQLVVQREDAPQLFVRDEIAFEDGIPHRIPQEELNNDF